MTQFADAMRAALADNDELFTKQEPRRSAIEGSDSFIEINSRTGKAKFMSPAFPEGKFLTNKDLVEFYGLDPADWDVASLRISSGEYWFREHDGADALTKFGHRYSGEFVSKKFVEAKTKTPKWEPINRAALAEITYKRPRAAKSNGEVKTVVVLPDPQIGFGRSVDGQWFTTHDPVAMDLALQICELVAPDEIINLGDTLDSAEWSKYLSGPTFAGMTQLGLDTAHIFLATQKAICDKVVVIDGNHDSPRFEKSIISNFQQAYGLRRAATQEDPVLSLPYLLRVDDLGVDWYGTYPNGKYFLRDDIAIIHGEKLSSRDQAQKGRLITHTIQGHIHRVEMQSRTWEGYNGEILSTWHMSPGTLSKITGEVPSFGSSLSIKGFPVRRVEDWQQGVLVLSYIDQLGASIEPRMVEISSKGSAMFDGKVLQSSDYVDLFSPNLES